ncbi:hypothetical protein Daus18300_003715 [Diaporthe australafricana]|uniref:DNA (cytosine-5-)-methyltransferase n=1 Tax=Diaporthe australafricana TaxID=127596 RepID=A0ABR3XD02_9PEZI
METFAGIGTFGLAAAKHGLTCAYANEADPSCVKTYEQNHCRGGPGIKNVDDRPIEQVTHDMFKKNLPRADILFGGFPCPSYSNNGKQEGFDSEKYGHYFYEIMKVIIRLQIPFVVLENVSTFATNQAFEGIKEVRKEFESAGYYMTWGVYKAVDFNLAQNRHRCFIVAVRKDLRLAPFQFSKPPGRRQGLALTDFLDPPSPPEDPSRYTLSDGGWVPNDVGKMARLVFVRDNRTLENRMSPEGLKTVGQWVPEGQTPKDSWRSGNMVYHHSGIASCILTKSDNWYQLPGHGGTDIIRQLSFREKLRLQGLPEDFQLSESPNQAQSQLGNTIPLPFAMQIMRDLQDQYPTILSSDSLTTTDCWPDVQPRDQDPEEEALMRRRLNNM